jgi:hypothetical protein
MRLSWVSEMGFALFCIKIDHVYHLRSLINVYKCLYIDRGALLHDLRLKFNLCVVVIISHLLKPYTTRNWRVYYSESG